VRALLKRGGIIDWRPVTRASRHILGLVLLAAALALPAAQKDRKQTESKQAEKNLKAVTERLEREQRQIAQGVVEKDRINRDLRQAERSVATARSSLREVRSQRAERAAARQKLVEHRAAKEAERERDRADLARQLRGAYFVGHNEPLKLLLNQRKINDVSRNLTYYGYFGRKRAEQMARLDTDVSDIKELTAKIDAEDAALARLELTQKERLGNLDSTVQQRGLVLASLEKELKDRGDQVARLKKEQQDLGRLIEKLSRASASIPFDPTAPFARLQRRLAWPVAGRISVDYHDVIGSDLRSQGIEIDAARDSEVRAVHEGVVVYADWRSQVGNLIILDHGNGYYSVYGHNEQLFRQKGTRVKAGEVIATAGDSGGRETPGLYFEIRRSGNPLNPHAWFSTPAPPAR
jgi:septal ring factor EnvC (AmiA/AmiB activator)